jgi:hypothetical protein
MHLINSFVIAVFKPGIGILLAGRFSYFGSESKKHDVTNLVATNDLFYFQERVGRD